VCDLETSTVRRLGAELGSCTIYTLSTELISVAQVYITLQTIVNISLTRQIASDGISLRGGKNITFLHFST